MLNRRGQTIAEYTIVLGIIILIFITMNPFIKRAVQGVVKTVADQIGVQEAADQNFDEGYLVSSDTGVSSVINRTTSEYLGEFTYTYNETMTIDTVSNTFLGSSENQ